MTLLFTFHLREKWANRGRATKAHQAAHPSPLQLVERFGTPRRDLPSLGKKANRGRATKAHQAAHLSPSDFGIPHPSNSHPFSLHKPLGLRAEPPPHRQVTFSLYGELGPSVHFSLSLPAVLPHSSTPSPASTLPLPLPLPVPPPGSPSSHRKNK